MFTFYNEVNDWLLVGGDLDLAADVAGLSPTEAVAELQSNGVTHVLDCRSEWSDQEAWGLPEGHYCHAPIIDLRGHTPPEEWYIAVENFVLRFWYEGFYGDRLYVHCQMGVNRGPSAAMLALLTVEDDLDPWAAFHMIRQARPVAGLVYAEFVGMRHLSQRGDCFEDFAQQMADYWTPERIDVSWNERWAAYKIALDAVPVVV
jgi:protein-tyrosine phosphatase